MCVWRPIHTLAHPCAPGRFRGLGCTDEHPCRYTPTSCSTVRRTQLFFSAGSSDPLTYRRAQFIRGGGFRLAARSGYDTKVPITDNNHHDRLHDLGQPAGDRGTRVPACSRTRNIPPETRARASCVPRLFFLLSTSVLFA